MLAISMLVRCPPHTLFGALTRGHGGGLLRRLYSLGHCPDGDRVVPPRLQVEQAELGLQDVHGGGAAVAVKRLEVVVSDLGEKERREMNKLEPGIFFISDAAILQHFVECNVILKFFRPSSSFSPRRHLTGLEEEVTLCVRHPPPPPYTLKGPWRFLLLLIMLRGGGRIHPPLLAASHAIYSVTFRLRPSLRRRSRTFEGRGGKDAPWTHGIRHA